MKRDTGQVVDRFEELFDRDIETLLTGGTPANTDLIPLRKVVDELRSFAEAPVSDGFIEFHAVESAAVAATRRSEVKARGAKGRSRELLHTLRHRAMAAAATLVMTVSATGMAWAADGAVPGDWYYGIDRALESFGIGAGGTAERLQELEATTPVPSEATAPERPRKSGESSPGPGEESTGLDRASTVVSEDRPSGPTSLEAKGPAEKVLAYLKSTEHVDGAVISILARGEEPPADIPSHARSEDKRHKDEEPSNVASPGKPGRPETPGKSESSNRP